MSTPDLDDLVRRLDLADARPDAAALRARSYDLLGSAGVPALGTRVVDVGCGAGRAVAELAERGVRAIGLDADERMVAAARRRWPAHAAAFRAGDALALPFGDGELGGYRADKVLHDLAEPARAVAEARRVLEPGGRAVLTGQDWDAIVIDSDRPGLTRTIVRTRAGRIASPRAARAHRALLLDGGFRDVTVEARTAVFTDETALPLLAAAAAACRAANAITDEEAGAWLGEQRARARAGRLLVAVPIFMAAGTRA
ncbi:methyltransferase domain-containing protein [Actinomadura rugatobispora]|uniref:Methyltransferase domain-containing protein n=1 Tax=Actinomadura rugatobispora TaxID=1994 RepID=A0ABW0ZRG0_9ACTN|nr:methyltransferase domain-containing protein [Actinomadura rugatobispora]